MKRRLLLLPTLAFALLACQQTPSLNLEPIGTIELAMNAQGNLTTSALLPNQNNPASSVAFTTDTFSVSTNGNKKFLTARFKVSNNSGAALQDLTLVAYNKTGNQTGTAIKNLQNFVGLSPAQLTSYAQSVTPSHGMNGTAVNTTAADMQIFSEDDVLNLSIEASSLLQGGEYLFPYGYVARAATGTSRTIPTGANTGFLTVGVQVPDNNEPTSSPYRFSMTFLAFTTPTSSRVTESVEEQSTSSASARQTSFAAAQLMTVGGSSTNTSTRECRVRVAGTIGTPLRYLVDTFNTSALTPAANSIVSLTQSISITTNRNVPALNTSDIKVRGSLTGDYTGTWAGAGTTALVFTPSTNFKVSEEITVTLPSGIKWCEAKSWGFRAVTRSSAATSLLGINYAASTEYAVGGPPSSVALGDLNSDGRLDAVTANNSANNVSVLLGNGNGTFQTKVDYATGSIAQSAQLADVNHDGKLDIVTANVNSIGGNDAIGILLGNGNGTFQANFNVPLSTNLLSFALGDVNNDNKLDIIAANTSSNVNILLGNGNGTFQFGGAFSVGSNTLSLALGDTNKDGNLDIVAANNDSNNVSFLRGNGNGTFQAKVDYATNTSPRSVVVADYDGDTYLDIIVANFGSNNVSIFRGNDTGNGTFAAKQDFSTGTNPTSVAVADVNGDNRLDIVTANTGQVSVLRRNHLNNFPPAYVARVDFNVTGGFAYAPNFVSLGDINKDGTIDIVASCADNYACVFLRQ